MKRKQGIVAAIVLAALLTAGCAKAPAQDPTATAAPTAAPTRTSTEPTAAPDATPYLTFEDRFGLVREVETDAGAMIGANRSFILNGVDWSVKEEEFLNLAYGLEGVKLNDESMRYHEYAGGDVHIVIPAEVFRIDGVDVPFRMSHAFVKETGQHAAASLSSWRCEADWETFRKAAANLAYMAFQRVQGPDADLAQRYEKIDARFAQWAGDLLQEDEPETLRWEQTLEGSNADLQLNVQYEKDGDRRIDVTATVKDVGTLVERVTGETQFVPAQDIAWGTDRESLVSEIPGMQDVVLNDATQWYTGDEQKGYYAASLLEDGFYNEGALVYRHGYSFDTEGKLDGVSFSTTDRQQYTWEQVKTCVQATAEGFAEFADEESLPYEELKEALADPEFEQGHWYWVKGDTLAEMTVAREVKIPGREEAEPSVTVMIFGPDAAQDRLEELKSREE